MSVFSLPANEQPEVCSFINNSADVFMIYHILCVNIQAVECIFFSLSLSRSANRVHAHMDDISVIVFCI